MLKKQNRLPRINKSKEAVTFSTPFFNIKVSEGGIGEKKFGFIVSKKVSKSAVVRNKTKRIIRSVIEEDLGRILSGKEILIISKKSLDWDQKEEIKGILENSLKKAKLL